MGGGVLRGKTKRKREGQDQEGSSHAQSHDSQQVVAKPTKNQTTRRMRKVDQQAKAPVKRDSPLKLMEGERVSDNMPSKWGRAGFPSAAEVNVRQGAWSAMRFQMLPPCYMSESPHVGFSGTDLTGEWNRWLTFGDAKAYDEALGVLIPSSVSWFALGFYTSLFIYEVSLIAFLWSPFKNAEPGHKWSYYKILIYTNDLFPIFCLINMENAREMPFRCVRKQLTLSMFSGNSPSSCPTGISRV